MGPDLRAADRPEHDGLGVLRRQRRPQPAALHRRESAGAVRHGHLPRRSAVRSTARRSPRRSSPARGRTRTSAASRRSRHVESKYNGLVLQLNRRLTKGLQFQVELHRSARDRQRPELADLHVGQQRAEPVRPRARGRHVELRSEAPFHRQRDLESRIRRPRAPRSTRSSRGSRSRRRLS